MSVLVAMIVAGLGLLGTVRVVLGVTAASTQNQNLASMATLSNGFWGVIQSNPSILVTPSFSGTHYTSSNYTSAPTALQPWVLQMTQALPNGVVTVTTGPDAASGAACSVAGGCAVTLEVDWTQVAAPGGSPSRTRSQYFYYQFGL